MSTTEAGAPPSHVLHADYSSLATLAECPERYHLSVEERWTPKRASISLHAGRALHAGLHELYASDWDVEESVAAMRDTWGAVTPPPEKSYLTAGHAEVVLRNYAEDRAGDALKPFRLHTRDLKLDVLEHFAPSVDDDGFVVFAETPLAVNFERPGGRVLTYAGLIDLPAELHGRLYIVDHKTTGQWVTERWAQAHARRYQLKGYAAMLQAATGVPVAGAFINGVYTGREAADPKEKWAKRTSKRSALFGPYLFRPDELEGVLRWAEDLLAAREFYRASGIWPKNDRACDYCAFREVCWGNPVMREGLLRRDFTQRTLTGILASGADSED